MASQCLSPAHLYERQAVPACPSCPRWFQSGVPGPDSSLPLTRFSLKTRLPTEHFVDTKMTSHLFWTLRSKNAGDIPERW